MYWGEVEQASNGAFGEKLLRPRFLKVSGI
jgi:hypothetical protein